MDQVHKVELLLALHYWEQCLYVEVLYNREESDVPADVVLEDDIA